MKLWDFLNGKKTFIGLAVLFLYEAGAMAGWYVRDSSVEATISGWTGLSLVHKAYKA